MSAVHKVKRHLLVCGLTALLFGALGVSASSAEALTSVIAPCTGQALSQPFLPWLDPSNYELAANGAFESTGAWTLAGGAQMVAGNNSFDVAGAGGSRSLSLPSGSSATSGEICVGLLSPTIRLFEINPGSAGASLKVEVIYRDIFGLTRSTQVGLLAAGATWTPTPPIPFLANLTALPLVTNGSTTVAFRFTPQRSAGLWRIDDVYVDPYKGS